MAATIGELEKLEKFLDLIENPNENVVKLMQSKIIPSKSDDDDDSSTVEKEEEEEEVIHDQDRVFDGSRHCVFKGVTRDNKPAGNGALLYANKDVFTGAFYGSIGNREGVLKGAETGSILLARWKRGKLTGYFSRDSGKGTREEGFYVGGKKDGFYRSFAPSCWGQEALRLFGRYRDGRLTGVCWESRLGGGYLVGIADEEGAFSGKEFTFIYPDFRTAIRGEFSRGKLVRGYSANVVGCEEVDHVLLPKVEIVDPNVAIEFDPSTIGYISSCPEMRDFWEDLMVEVKESDIQGQGLFAKTDLEEGTIIALFNGVRIPNTGRKRAHSDYCISLNPDIDLDIPDNMTSLDCYRATLGHKANHSFAPNAEWTVFDHPRFGLIRAIAALIDIERGEEILVDYKMPLCKAPDWYLHLWVKHVREEKSWTAVDVDKFIARQKELTGKTIALPPSDENASSRIKEYKPRGAANLQSIINDEQDGTQFWKEAFSLFRKTFLSVATLSVVVKKVFDEQKTNASEDDTNGNDRLL